MNAEMDFTVTSEWLVSGDFPARDTLRAAFLIDGRMTMLEMCYRFLCAKQSISIVCWGLTPDLPLVRGKQHHAGEPGSPEEELLLTALRARGLTEDAVSFWQRSEVMSVTNVLGYVVSKGVAVRVILWDALTLPMQSGPKQVKDTLDAVGVLCLLDDSHLNLHHPIASLHQKAAVVDDRYAFVGGIDMMAQADGEYDRWDTKGHAYDNLLRRKKNGDFVSCWHDVHVMFEGPAVSDVAQNFRQRWNDVVERHNLDPQYILSDPSLTGGLEARRTEEIDMQVVRTVPANMYAFTPEEGISTILSAYLKAISRAKHTIYIENQYIWRRTFLGLETPLLSLPTEVMDQLFQELAAALQRGVSVTLILPDNPNVGREFTDDGLKYLWELAPDAVASGKLQVYTLASCSQDTENISYAPIYVHAKVAIVDDEWVTLGSANLNNRGMKDDAELNIALWQPSMARGLRMLLMAEHLGLADEDTLFRIVETMGRTDPTAELSRMGEDLRLQWESLQTLIDEPSAGINLLVEGARANLLAIREHKPLIGHIVPYVRYDLAQEYDLKVNSVNGWLNQLATATVSSDNKEQSTENNKEQGTEISATALSTEKADCLTEERGSIMTKANTSGRKQQSGTPQGTATTTKAAAPMPLQTQPALTSSSKKSGKKNNRPQIGGTAVQGAKSTLPKPPPSSNNAQQQQNESSNRTMRRRMQNLGGGEEQSQGKKMQDQRRKRIERRKQRIEERRADLRKSLPNGGKIRLGRRNLYFLLGVAVIIILIIVFALLKQQHII